MKRFLLLILLALIGAVVWTLYEDRQKTPLERAAEDMGDAIETVGKKFEKKAKEIERSIEAR